MKITWIIFSNKTFEQRESACRVEAFAFKIPFFPLYKFFNFFRRNFSPFFYFGFHEFPAIQIRDFGSRIHREAPGYIFGPRNRRRRGSEKRTQFLSFAPGSISSFPLPHKCENARKSKNKKTDESTWYRLYIENTNKNNSKTAIFSPLFFRSFFSLSAIIE